MKKGNKVLAVLLMVVFLMGNIFSANVYALDPVAFSNTATLTADFNGTHSNTQASGDAVTLGSNSIDSYTKLLLHNNGTNTSTVFTDSSASAHTATANGNARIDTAQYKYGGASGLFDGTGDYLSTPDSSDFKLGSGDFTIDFWVRFDILPSTNELMALVSKGQYGTAGDWEMNIRNISGTNYLQFMLLDNVGGVLADVYKSISLNTGTWYHLSAIRNGTNLYAAIDGTLSAATDLTGKTYVEGTRALYIGYNYNRLDLNGHIDELRISKGIARWTSNFTPSTTEYSGGYIASGTYTHGEIDISSGVVANDTKITYTKTTPANTTLTVEARVYNGTTWGDWTAKNSGDTLVTNGTNLTGYKIQWRANLSTTDSSATPSLNDVTVSNNVSANPATFSNTATLTADFNGTHNNTQASGDAVTLGSNSIDSYTKLLLHNNGTDTSTVFSDSSTVGKKITVNGDTYVNTAQKKFGDASGHFDGDGDYLSISNNNDFVFGTDDFTLDFWIRFPNVNTQQGIMGQYVDANNLSQLWYFGSASNFKWQFYHKDGGTVRAQYIMTNAWSPSNDTWYHIVFARSGSTAYLFIDGVSQALTETVAFGTLGNIASDLTVGMAHNVGGDHIYTSAYFDEFRLSKGIARWTTNFTPPSTAYTTDQYTKLLPHFDTGLTDGENIPKTVTANGNARVVSAQSAIGRSSCYFDGTGDYTSVPDHADFNAGSSDFAIDFFVRRGAINSRQAMCGQANAAGGDTFGFIEFQADNTVKAYCNDTGDNPYTVTSTGTITDTTKWHHIALVRNGNSLKLYIDGTNDGNTDVTGITFKNSSANFSLGRGGDYDGLYFNGYIDDFRFSKGIARYTSAFTPQTTQYDADSYTKLLLHFEGGITDYSESGRHQVTANGNAQIDTAQYKFGGASGLFDGTGDYLSIPDSDDWNFGTGDFTVDCWFRSAVSMDSNSEYGICGKYVGGATLGQFTLEFYYGKIRVYTNSTTGYSSGDFSPAANTWYHLALVRSGNSLKFFIDGSQVGSDVDVTGVTFGSISSSMYVGSYASSGGYFNGWIDALRISKGIARWASNFTPPTAEYTDANVASGTYTHGEIDISSGVLAYDNKITYSKTTPTNTTLAVEARVYNGTTWGDWTAKNSGDTLVTNGINLSGYKVQWRANLSTTDSSATPSLNDVTVSNSNNIAVTGVSLNKSSTTIAVNNTETLTATVAPANASNKSVTWSSNNEAKATVSSEGVVTAVSPGTAVITVTTVDGSYTATCNVTTENRAVTGVSIKASTTLGIGQTETLVPTFIPSDATNKSVTWSSSNTAIATVDTNGLVTALNQGTAVITVTTNEGNFTDTCSVCVKVLSTYTITYEYDANGNLTCMTISET